MSRAACDPETGANPEDWFDRSNGQGFQRAMAACQGCPKRQKCADWALAEGIPYGIYGGVSEAERREAWALAGGAPKSHLDDYDRQVWILTNVRAPKMSAA